MVKFVNEDMQRRWFLQYVFWVIALTTFAQQGNTYMGKVIADEEPLPGAQFRLPQTKTIIAISGNTGDFTFTHEADSVILEAVGFQSLIVYPSDVNKAYYLIHQQDLLNAVVVTENKQASTLKNATISLDIIQPELVSNTAPLAANEVVQRISGLQVVDNQPTIRSGSGWSYGAGSRVQVLVDGIPILSGDAGQPLWSFVPTEAIESIEVLKGAGSVLYGSSALNGVINFKTKRAGSKPFTEAFVTSGFYDLPRQQGLRYQGNQRNSVTNLSVFHSQKIKNIGITAGLNGLFDEGYKMGDYDKRVRLNIGLEKINPNNNVIWGIKSSLQRGNSANFLLWESADLGFTALDSGITTSLTRRFTLDPYAKWNSKSWSYTLNGRLLSVDNQVNNGDSLNDQSNNSQLGYLEFRASRIWENGLSLQVGAVGQATQTQSPLFSGSQVSSNMSVYAQAQKIWNRWRLSLGTRYEYFTLNERQEGRPVIRGGVNYELAKATFLRASYGEGYRFPSIAESYITTTVGPVSIYPNPSLNSETGTNLEFGLKQGFKINRLNGFIDFAVFEMQFNNLMEFTFGQWGPIEPPLFGAGFKTLNTGNSVIRGLEGNTQFVYQHKGLDISGFLGYTFVNPQMLEPQKVIATDNVGGQLTFENTSSDASVLKYRPQHQFKADILANISRIQLGFGIQAQSEMRNIDTAFIEVPIGFYVPGIASKQALSRFMLFNLRTGYAITSRLKANLIINNLANRLFIIRPADYGETRSFRIQLVYTTQ